MAGFDGTEGAVIDIAQAATWTGNYRRDAATEGSEPVVRSHFYGREILQKLLDQDGCMGIRMYYAVDEKGQKQLIIVGADAEGNDLEDMVVDHSTNCPPDCFANGTLNG